MVLFSNTRGLLWIVFKKYVFKCVTFATHLDNKTQTLPINKCRHKINNTKYNLVFACMTKVKVFQIRLLILFCWSVWSHIAKVKKQLSQWLSLMMYLEESPDFSQAHVHRFNQWWILHLHFFVLYKLLKIMFYSSNKLNWLINIENFSFCVCVQEIFVICIAYW